MKRRISTKAKKLYDFYKGDLTIKDIEKLVVRDVPDLYDFYAGRMEKPEYTQNKIRRFIRTVKNIFIEFLEQLTPIRRIIFSVALVIYFFSYINADWQWATIAFILVCLLIAFELADKLTAKNELAVAQEIQKSLMPKSPPQNAHYEISCFMENAREVGGDYYDFIKCENSSEKLFVVVGDISGKGMAAALHMVQVQSVLHQTIYECKSPKEILSSINNKIKRILPRGSFFTVCIASINPDGSLLLSRAGHLPVLHYKNDEDTFKNLLPKGIGIGIAENELFDTTLGEICVKPNKGDILVFYTDGVIEARNRFKQEFGEERLKKIISKYKDSSPEIIKNYVVQNISIFMENAPSHDDFTLVILKAK